MAGTALIFGASGQDGPYVAAACRARGLEVVAVSRRGPVVGDVGSQECVETLVQAHRPSLLFQLAADSALDHDLLGGHRRTIVDGTLFALEAVERFAPACRVFVPGSGLQFRNSGAPLGADAPFAATSAYAWARIAAVEAARYYRGRGVRVQVGYLFHHESPRRSPRHLSQTIVQGAARIAAGQRESLAIGDLEVEREWTFAGDVVEGMLVLLDHDHVPEAVIASGEALPVRAFVAEVFRRHGLDWREHVRPRPGYRAPFRRLVGDPAPLRSLGWAPRVGLGALVAQMVAAPEPASA